MIKDLLNIELKDRPIEGFDVNIIKKYVVKTSDDESFIVRNYSIILIKSGQFKIKLKDITQELFAQDLIVIPKNSYCTLLEEKGKLQLLLLAFTSEFIFENCLNKELVDSLCFLLGESPSKIALYEKDFLVLSLIYKLLYYINKDASHNPRNVQLQHISFSLFLYELKSIFNCYTSEVSENFSRKQSLTIQFLTILTIHCKKQHGVKFYAGALFVTPGYLNKIVKQITGKNVKSLIDQAIINEAKNLLENSQSPIALIAQDFEFDNLSNFSTYFKKHTSFPPSEYRSNSIERFKSR